MASEQSMPVVVPANNHNFDDLLQRVKAGREHFVVQQDGEDVAVLLSASEYQALLHEREISRQDQQRRLQQFRDASRSFGEEIAKQGLSEEDVMAELEKDRDDTYREHYGDG